MTCSTKRLLHLFTIYALTAVCLILLFTARFLPHWVSAFRFIFAAVLLVAFAYGLYRELRKETLTGAAISPEPEQKKIQPEEPEQAASRYDAIEM